MVLMYDKIAFSDDLLLKIPDFFDDGLPPIAEIEDAYDRLKTSNGSSRRAAAFFRESFDLIEAAQARERRRVTRLCRERLRDSPKIDETDSFSALIELFRAPSGFDGVLRLVDSFL